MDLGRRGLSVTAMSDRRITAGGLSKHTDRFVRYPNPRDHEAAFVETLVDELRQREYDMLLAGNNRTVLPIVEHRDRLADWKAVYPCVLDVTLDDSCARIVAHWLLSERNRCSRQSTVARL